MVKRIIHHLPLAVVGGLLYVGIELVWRGRSHWSMFLLGGLCFAAIGMLNEGKSPPPMPVQMLLGAGIVTVAELVVGLIVNVWLGLGVWDYSHMPMNLWGQISLTYSLAWFALSGVAVLLEDFLHQIARKLR